MSRDELRALVVELRPLGEHLPVLVPEPVEAEAATRKPSLEGADMGQQIA